MATLPSRSSWPRPGTEAFSCTAVFWVSDRTAGLRKIDPVIAAGASSETFRATIAPIADRRDRPLWSVMVPVFNGADELRNSLQSVLSQDPGPRDMEIVVVDDCSTRDDPEAVVSAIGRGRVGFHCQPRNVGHSRNFNTCIERARGQLVHILHADDWVADGFYRQMTEVFAREPRIGAAFCRHGTVGADGEIKWASPLERDTPGVLDDWLQRIARRLEIQPPSMVVRRESYERLGGFDTRMRSCGEDWEMWVRIAAHFPVGYVPEMLAFYRDSADSVTKRSVRTGQNIRDVRMATQIVQSYLPEDLAPVARRRALENWADWALYWAYQSLLSRQYRAALVQLREALICSRSRRTLRQAARISRFGLQQIAGRLKSRLAR